MRTEATDREPLCETSEAGERLIPRRDIVPMAFFVGRRMLEVLGYQRVSQICFRLKMSASEVNAVLKGERMPSGEMLLCVRRVTGASIDWILTGEGPKYVSPPHPAEVHESLPLAVLAAHRERRPDQVNYLQ